jgi:hypothetical protein
MKTTKTTKTTGTKKAGRIIDSYSVPAEDLIYEVTMVSDYEFVVSSRYLSDGHLAPGTPISFGSRDRAVSIAKSLSSRGARRRDAM